jgi:hypothetical protein
MEAKFLFAVLILVLILWAGHKVHAWVHAQKFLKFLWRWFTGMPLHGKPITNAGWKRKGYGPALTPTGHAIWWWYLPRWKRSGHRTGGTFAFLVLVWAFLVNPAATMALLLALTLAGLGLLGLRAWRAWQDRKHRHTWLEPLHLAAHELAGHPRALPAKSWIVTQLDDNGAVQRAQLKMGPDWRADPREEERLVLTASRRLGIEAAEPTWRRAGPAPLLILAPSKPPPPVVLPGELMDAVRACRGDEFVSGLGKKAIVQKASLVGDSPHAAINMGSGGGKSSLAGWWALQWMMRGAYVMVLDYKWHSLPWMFKDKDGNYDYLPNVAYLCSVEQIHAGLVWLGERLQARNRDIQRQVTASGALRGSVGKPLIVIAEEMNYVTPELRAYWKENGDGGKSPALKALGAVAFAGRAAGMFGIFIGQMLTADATGSRDNAMKTNIAVWAMARYGGPSWNTSVGRDTPMPPSPDHVGRIQLVTASGVHETQTPKPDGELYRELALSGEVTPCPEGMPGAHQVPAVLGARQLSAGGSDQPFVLGAEPIAGQPGALVTLAEAAEQGISKRTKENLQRASTREPEFPQSAFPKRQGVAAKYDAVVLAEYEAAR